MWNQTMNWNQTMKLSRINRNTVLHCLKKNKLVETHKKLGVNGTVRGSIFFP